MTPAFKWLIELWDCWVCFWW